MKGLFVSGLLAVALVVGFGGATPALATIDSDFEDQCIVYSDPDGWVGQTRVFACDQESQYSGHHWESAEEDVEQMLHDYCVNRHAGSYGATIIYFNFNESPSHSMDSANGGFWCTGIWD
jgi:hypothetical protein